MRVGEIVKPENFTLFRRLLDAKIWNREAEKFSYIDLDVLYSLVNRFETTKSAQRACDIVVLKLKAAQISGHVEYLRVDQKQFVRPPIMQDDFEKKISTMPLVRQDCIRFALEMQWPLDAAIALERVDIKHYLPEMNERAIEIINRQPVALFKRTAFWETVGDEPRILISLRHHFLQVFSQSWETVMNQYDTNTGKFATSVTKEEALNAILKQS